MTGNYPLIYYSAILLCAMCMPFFYRAYGRAALPEASTAVVFIIGLVYLVATLRTAGDDLGNYRYAYEQDLAFIPDRGFQLLMQVGRAAGLPFHAFMFVVGLITLFSLKRVARYFEVNYGLLLLFWFAHLAVGRELTQLRVGLAISIACLALTSRSWLLRLPLYALCVATHASAIAFVGAYEVSRLIAHMPSRRARGLAILVTAAGIAAVGQALSSLAFLDERIAIYLRETENPVLGSPVSSYSILMLHLAVLAVCLMARSTWSHSDKLLPIFYLQVLGLVAFAAFSGASIFAFRLSNVMFSLYPILLLHSMNGLQLRFGGRPAGKLAAAILSLVFIAMFIGRPGSFGSLTRIGF